MSERFSLKGEVVVLDRETGLMWQRSASPGRLAWKEGFSYIASLNTQRFAGHGDWRYPTKEELATLVLPEEDRRTGLFLDHLFEKQRNCWSSTDGEGDTACYVDFFYGDLCSIDQGYANNFVRAVRTDNDA